jgi:hypothetical protein
MVQMFTQRARSFDHDFKARLDRAKTVASRFLQGLLSVKNNPGRGKVDARELWKDVPLTVIDDHLFQALPRGSPFNASNPFLPETAFFYQVKAMTGAEADAVRAQGLLGEALWPIKPDLPEHPGLPIDALAAVDPSLAILLYKQFLFLSDLTTTSYAKVRPFIRILTNGKHRDWDLAKRIIAMFLAQKVQWEQGELFDVVQDLTAYFERKGKVFKLLDDHLQALPNGGELLERAINYVSH